jgi:hypothetical protein
MKRQQIINHPSQLSALSVLPVVRTPGAGRIVIADAKVDDNQRLAWERKLNHLYFACGCVYAAVGLTVAVLGYATWLVVRPGHWSDLAWRDLWIGLATIAAAAGIGKTIGLLRANRRLKQAVGEIQRDWKVPLEEEGRTSTCG